MLYRHENRTATLPVPAAPSAPTVLKIYTPAPSITGSTASRRAARLTKTERAVAAADCIDRGLGLRRPTIKQWASVWGVNASYVHQALRLSAGERAGVNAGLLPLTGLSQLTAPELAGSVEDAVEMLAGLVAEHGTDGVLELLTEAEAKIAEAV